MAQEFIDRTNFIVEGKFLYTIKELTKTKCGITFLYEVAEAKN